MDRFSYLMPHSQTSLGAVRSKNNSANAKHQTGSGFFNQRTHHKLDSNQSSINDYINVVGTSALQGTKMVTQSHQRIYQARVSGPQVLSKQRKSNAGIRSNKLLYKDNSVKKHNRQLSAMQHINTDSMKSDLGLEFKNGITIEGPVEKKITLAQHRKLTKGVKIPHECFSFDNTMSSIKGTKSREKMEKQSSSKQAQKQPKDNSIFNEASNATLIKNLYQTQTDQTLARQPHSAIFSKDGGFNIVVSPDNARNHTQVSDDKQNTGKSINARIKSKMKPIHTSQNSNVLSGKISMVDTKLDNGSSGRQIKTACVQRRNTRAAVIKNNYMINHTSVGPTEAITPNENSIKIRPKDFSRRSLNQSRASMHERALMPSTISGLSQEDIVLYQARDKTLQKLNKRLKTSSQLTLTEDQILNTQTGLKTEETAKHLNIRNGQLSGQIDIQIQPNKAISSNFQLSSPNIEENQKANDEEKSVQQKVQQMKQAFTQGIQKQISYNKMNQISSDHVKQLLSKSKNKFDVEDFVDNTNPTIQESITQAKVIFASKQRNSFSSNQFHKKEDSMSPSRQCYQDQQNNKLLTANNTIRSTVILSPKSPNRTQNRNKGVFQPYGLDDIVVFSQNDGKNSTDRNESNQQHTRAQTLTSINQMINKMFDDESGTPIRNSLHFAVRPQRQSSIDQGSINSIYKGQQLKYEQGSSLDSSGIIMVNESIEDDKDYAQKQTLIPRPKSDMQYRGEVIMGQQLNTRELMNIKEEPKFELSQKNSHRRSQKWSPLKNHIFSDDQMIQGRVKQIYEIKQIENRMKFNPNVQKIVNDKNIQEQSFLSPYTIIENNLVGLTTDHLIHKTNTKTISKGATKDQKQMSDMLNKTTWQIQSAQNDLKRIIDNGQFHTQLWLNQMVEVTVIPKITQCFIVDLKEFENPFNIFIRYPNRMPKQEVKVKIQKKAEDIQTNLASQLKRSVTRVVPEGELELNTDEKKEGTASGDKDRASQQQPTPILIGGGTTIQGGASTSPVVRKKTLKQKLLQVQSQVFEDLSFYGSFYHKEPAEENSTVKATNPRKIIVQEITKGDGFQSKFFYITLESITGTKVQITATNPQDYDSLQKKRMMEKKKEAALAKKNGGKAKIIPKPGALCAQQREDIERAMYDKQFQNELYDRMNKALKNQKCQNVNPRSYVETTQYVDGEVFYTMEPKDILNENIQQIQNYTETKIKQFIQRRNQREHYKEEAKQRTKNKEEVQRILQLSKQQRWQEFRLERKKVIEEFIDAKAMQRKSEQLLVLIKRGIWISTFARYFKEYMIRRTKEENMKFCIFRAKFYWKQRKTRIRAELKIPAGYQDYGEFIVKRYKYKNNWNEIYKNYVRNVVSYSQMNMHQGIIEKSKEIFTPVIIDHCEKIHMKACLVTSYEKFIFIQMRMIRAINSKKRYFIQLRKLWYSKLQKMQVNALTKKSKANQQVAEQVTQMIQMEEPENANMPFAILIKKFLERYFYWVMLRYSIAFFQWRRKFLLQPNDDIKSTQDQIDVNEKLEQLQEVFDSKIGYIRKYSHKLCDMSDQIKNKAMAKAKQQQTTDSGHKLAKDSDKKRKVSEKRGSHHNDKEEQQLDVHQINHFHEIGWMNPDGPFKSFAGEFDQNNIVRKNFEDLVYDKQFYLSENFPPPVIFLPSEQMLEVMIKKVTECKGSSIEELMSKFGISSICHICDEDIKPKEIERFRWPSYRKVDYCPHFDFHMKCMSEAAAQQGKELCDVQCPLCLEQSQQKIQSVLKTFFRLHLLTPDFNSLIKQKLLQQFKK